MRSALLLLVLLATSAPALRAAPASGSSEYLDRFFAFGSTARNIRGTVKKATANRALMVTANSDSAEPTVATAKAREAPAVSGSLTLEEALDRLLAESGLSFRFATADEVIVFTTSESDPARAQLMPHGAFDNPLAGPDAPPRVSLEMRGTCYWYA